MAEADVEEGLILDRVSKRVKERLDSLEKLSNVKHRALGIEGWLKVETIAALEPWVNDVKNKGPDLTIKSEQEKPLETELKGFNRHNWKWIKEGITKYEKTRRPADICLFLQLRGENPAEDEKELEKEGFKITTRNIGSEWILGILKKRT